MSNIFKRFPRTFWVANTIELFERFAWYGFFMLFANYLTKSSDFGGLEFSQNQKALIMSVGTGILYFLPVITGAIADKWGYKKVLILSFFIYASAFILMPMFDTFTGVFLIYLYLAVGAALFKPVISATVAKTTTDRTASIGFGIFYMMVNIGSFLGPLLTLAFKDTSYELVFYISAAIISVNFILILFYKEPERMETKEPLGETIKQVFRNIFTVLIDFKFVLFLVIAAGFWTMYLQLFYTLPVFIEQWVDTSSWFNYFSANIPFIAETYSIGDQMDPEFITNFDAMFIILFQVLISSIIMRWKALNVMMTGFIISTVGLSLTLITQNPIFIVSSLFIFAIGEMTASPKITEYIGKIAPADKKALYMGYSFIPMFLGNLFTGLVSGPVYQKTSDLVSIVREEAAKIKLDLPEQLSQTEELNALANELNMSHRELVNYLWTSYNPSQIWMVVAGIGAMAAVCLFFYNRYLIKD
ncbi:MFS transporter [Lentimicrobium sp. L6]|uniref:MFS transporter n=1 Tax=Lentimicrobium sp. L6 TaxID=2735916 RepID=UPI0015542669|nr:MFS transporter [Lentimicrobium sp. L6]NPD83655.1 MFS transporter [Lentimicrobium sp. L6]